MKLATFVSPLLLTLVIGSAHAQTLTWTKLSPTTTPSARRSHTMAYDGDRDRIVLFGGNDGSGFNAVNDTWEFDGTTWNQIKPSKSPGKRYGHAMAYDAKRKRMVLFGGQPGTGFLNDTWEFDGSNWVQVTPKTKPAARGVPVMFYDQTLSKVVLFSGWTGRSTLSDMWTWDGTNWTALSPKTRPSARGWASLAYDTTTKRAVLFSGRSGLRSYLDDTWEWNGSDWKKIATPTKPPGRGDAVMVNANGSLLLFGGSNSKGNLGDTWLFQGNRWSQLLPKTSPSARQYAGAVFDTKRQRVLLFGGIAHPKVFNDMWSMQFPDPCHASATAFWPAEYNARDSAGTHHGTLKGATFTNGVRGTAFSFDGKDDYVEVPDHADWNFGSKDFSIELWVRLKTIKRANAMIGQSEGNPGVKWMLQHNYINTDDNLTFHIQPKNVILSVPWKATANQWHHVVLSRRGSTYSFYADGKLLGSKTHKDPVPNPKTPLRIGQDGEMGRYLSGAIDEVAIYRRALSAFEIGALYKARGNCPSSENFGRGCASTTVLPTLTAATPPALGKNFTLHARGFLPKPQFGQLIIGSSNKTWGIIPLPLKLDVIHMKGCSLHVSMDMVNLIVTDSQGRFTGTFKVPSQAALIGIALYGQAWAPDPEANDLGVAMTNALKVVVVR